MRLNTGDKMLIYLLSVMLGSALIIMGLTAAMMPHLRTNSEALRRWQQMVVLDILVMAVSTVIYALARTGYKRLRR